jgi:hypothetical protein
MDSDWQFSKVHHEAWKEPTFPKAQKSLTKPVKRLDKPATKR